MFETEIVSLFILCMVFLGWVGNDSEIIDCFGGVLFNAEDVGNANMAHFDILI